MKSFFSQKLYIYIYKVFLASLILLTLVFCYIYFATDNKWTPLFGGIATGLVVAIIQLFISLNEHNDIERFRKLRIREVLPYREGKEYYEKMIVEAKDRIILLGNTANRFLKDFAHPTRADSQALRRALGVGVKVRILLPKASYLTPANQAKSAESLESMKELKLSFPAFEYRFYDHMPCHSIVCIDNECLVGPIFAHVESVDSPAIHVASDSAFVTHYLKHFEEEWANAAEQP